MDVKTSGFESKQTTSEWTVWLVIVLVSLWPVVLFAIGVGVGAWLS